MNRVLTVLVLLATCLVFAAPPTRAGDSAPATPAGLAPYDSARAEAAALVSGTAEATRAYLDAVPPERAAFTRAYARGNYLNVVLDFLVSTLLVSLLALATGLSRRMRDAAARLTPLRGLQAALYWIMYLPFAAVLGFPLVAWHDYSHEKAFGLLHQPFGGWFGDYLKGLLIGWILGALFMAVIYAIVSRVRSRWWLWAWLVMLVFMAIGEIFAPVYLMPVFNKFTPIRDVELRDSILAMAHAHGVPAKEVYEMDMSRRSNRIGAFVTGLGNTMRIVIYDTTLRRSRRDEIRFIVGHELGHYVERHMWWGFLFNALTTLGGLLFVAWGFEVFRRRWPGLGIEGIADPAGLPVVFLLFGLYNFALTPLTNGHSRYFEARADAFGLEASRLPDAAARAFLELGEYRDLDPSPAVEFLFYDHPAGRGRIRHAMDWKAAHAGTR